MNEDNKFSIGFRLRHRAAHISISLSVMFITGMALFGHLTGSQWAYQWGDVIGMAPNTAACLFLLAGLELFEAFNLKM